jgi:hypothetical protein
MSCASCHNAAGGDGRTWDFSQFGEGLRTTITLEGRGQGHFALGLGLMSDEDFFAGTRSEPLGDPKAGFSADLDALAAYVESLDRVGVSPYRQGDGSLSSEGAAGRMLFTNYGCYSCHSGAVFTDSENEVLHDVGTLTAESGPQSALDTPSLLGQWSEGPYLHDGSAATLQDAIDAHTLLDLNLSPAELGLIAAYVSEIDDIEAAAWTPPAPRASQIHHGVIEDVGSSWQLVTLPYSYADMVVVASLAYDGSWLPAVTRVRNAVGDSFELRVQNPSGEPLSGYTVSYLVAEAGAYTRAADGMTFEAVKVVASETDGHDNWVGQQEFYANTYANPVVIGQVMTENDVNWSAFWASNGRRFSAPSSAKLYVGKHVGEDPDTTRAPETLGYLVFEAGLGTVGAVSVEAGITPDIVEGVVEPENLWIESVASESGTAVVSLGSMDGNDGGWAVRYGTGAFEGLELPVAVDEDQVGGFRAAAISPGRLREARHRQRRRRRGGPEGRSQHHQSRSRAGRRSGGGHALHRCRHPGWGHHPRGLAAVPGGRDGCGCNLADVAGRGRRRCRDLHHPERECIQPASHGGRLRVESARLAGEVRTGPGSADLGHRCRDPGDRGSPRLVQRQRAGNSGHRHGHAHGGVVRPQSLCRAAAPRAVPGALGGLSGFPGRKT